jgi:hypothetical protein
MFDFSHFFCNHPVYPFFILWSSQQQTQRIAIHIAANIMNHNIIQITTGAEFGMKNISVKGENSLKYYKIITML